MLPISPAIGAGLGQALVTKRGPRPVASVAMAGLAGGFVLLSGLPVHSDYLGQMLPALLVFGLGLGAAATSFSIATLAGAHPSDAGLASGLNNTFESIFGALGTAITASVAVTHTNSLLHAGSVALPALRHTSCEDHAPRSDDRPRDQSRAGARMNRNPTHLKTCVDFRPARSTHG